jgi:predicted nucleic acid-binding protein
VRTFIDTNVLVYAWDEADPAKKRQALSALDPAPDNDLVLSTQVLNEFYVVVTRPGRILMSSDDAVRIVERFALSGVEPIDADLVLRAHRIHRDHGVSYWDSLIVAAASRAACERILTEDLSAGTVIEGVRVENPFA